MGKLELEMPRKVFVSICFDFSIFSQKFQLIGEGYRFLYYRLLFFFKRMNLDMKSFYRIKLQNSVHTLDSFLKPIRT